MLQPLILPLTRRTLVIGGGIAGMVAALDVAEAGYPVILVEQQPDLGGKMRSFSGTYLNFEAASDLLLKKIQTVNYHPNIQVLTNAEVIEVSGYVGNFRVKIAKKDTTEQPHLTDSQNVQDTQDSPFTFFDIGAIIVATGWQAYDTALLPEYGGNEIPDVVDSLTFETMLAN